MEEMNKGDAPSTNVPQGSAQPHTPAAWEGGKCRVPMWIMGTPAGLCGEPANGPQWPISLLQYERPRGFGDGVAPYCHGPCCPKHGGPRDGEPILFTDGTDERGHRMWCAVMPGFENLQESPAGFDVDPMRAIAKLTAAISRARGE